MHLEQRWKSQNCAPQQLASSTWRPMQTRPSCSADWSVIYLFTPPSPPRFPTPFSTCPLRSLTFPLVPANSTVPVSIQSTWWYQVTKRIHHTDAHEAQLLSVQRERREAWR